MRLEGSLDAFSLPDIFQLLSYTKKTGTLHLRREQLHGVVHLRNGAVTGARSDAARQALGRRLVGAGIVDDDLLADAVESVLDDPSCGLARALATSGRLDTEILRSLACEQATDAVFDLLRWDDGDFAFVVDEPDPDDLGAFLTVEEVVAEGRRRIEAWTALASAVPSVDAVVTLVPSPADDPVLTRDEWALLTLVDGSRTVGELVGLSGRGEFVVVNALAALVDRGLLAVGEPSPVVSAVAQRQQLLAALESQPEPAAATVAPVEPPAAPEVRAAVIPERPEPFLPARRPEHVEEPLPALTRMSVTTARASAPALPSGPASSVGAVSGAHALAPDLASAPSSHIDRDPSVNKSLLLRLIAGVRGL